MTRPAQATTALLVCSLLSTAPGWTSVTQNRLPANVRAALAKPSRVELLSLEPGRPRRKPVRSFHGWNVLGATMVVQSDKQRRLLSAVERGIAESDGSLALCFEPRHGVAVAAGETVVDLVICYECLQVKAYVNGKEIEGALTAESPQAVLDQMLAEAGVPLGSRPEGEQPEPRTGP